MIDKNAQNAQPEMEQRRKSSTSQQEPDSWHSKNYEDTFGLSSLDTSRVANMSCMFDHCSKATSIELTGLDTSSATNMAGMFKDCSSLASLDLSHFNTSRVADMSCMFSGCPKLETIFATMLFSTWRVTNGSRMFYGCTSLRGIEGTAYDASSVDVACARIDGGAAAPGYFTDKSRILRGDANGNSIVNIVDSQIAYDIATTDLYSKRLDYKEMCLRADVTGDGKVYAEDAFAIQYRTLHNERS